MLLRRCDGLTPLKSCTSQSTETRTASPPLGSCLHQVDGCSASVGIRGVCCEGVRKIGVVVAQLSTGDQMCTCQQKGSSSPGVLIGQLAGGEPPMCYLLCVIKSRRGFEFFHCGLHL